jgi:hypothetical protein
LAAETDDLDEARRCLEAILDLDPDNEPAQGALQWVTQRQAYIADLHPANAEELANVAAREAQGRASR